MLGSFTDNLGNTYGCLGIVELAFRELRYEGSFGDQLTIIQASFNDHSGTVQAAIIQRSFRGGSWVVQGSIQSSFGDHVGIILVFCEIICKEQFRRKVPELLI